MSLAVGFILWVGGSAGCARLKPYQRERLARSFQVRCEFGDLRADMNVDAADNDMAQCRGVSIERRRRVECRQLGLDAGELTFDGAQLVGVSREALFEPRAFAR